MSVPVRPGRDPADPTLLHESSEKAPVRALVAKMRMKWGGGGREEVALSGKTASSKVGLSIFNLAGIP